MVKNKVLLFFLAFLIAVVILTLTYVINFGVPKLFVISNDSGISGNSTFYRFNWYAGVLFIVMIIVLAFVLEFLQNYHRRADLFLPSNPASRLIPLELYAE